MFDRIIQAPAYPQRIEKTVHEHRAPTDDSISLLNEMQEKALSNVIARLTPPGNTVTGVICEMAPLQDPYDRIVFIAFELNGKKHDIRVKMTSIIDVGRAQAWGKFFDEMGKAIARELFDSVFKQMEGQP